VNRRDLRKNIEGVVHFEDNPGGVGAVGWSLRRGLVPSSPYSLLTRGSVGASQALTVALFLSVNETLSWTLNANYWG